MNEPFNLPVTVEGQEYELKARFERWGYTHRFAVLVGEETIAFEPDEEGSYRVIADNGQSALSTKPSLLQAIADLLVQLMGR